MSSNSSHDLHPTQTHHTKESQETKVNPSSAEKEKLKDAILSSGEQGKKSLSRWKYNDTEQTGPRIKNRRGSMIEMMDAPGRSIDHYEPTEEQTEHGTSSDEEAVRQRSRSKSTESRRPLSVTERPLQQQRSQDQVQQGDPEPRGSLLSESSKKVKTALAPNVVQPNAPSKRKRLSSLFHFKPSKLSGPSSPWKSDAKKRRGSEQGKESDAQHQEADQQAKREEEEAIAKHEENIQSIVLSLPSHPQAEAFAYQARSHFQAYYGLLDYSLGDSHQSPGDVHLPWNPLRVIRWRKQVLAEEHRRKDWDANVNEQRRARSRIPSSQTEPNFGKDGQADRWHDSPGKMTDSPGKAPSVPPQSNVPKYESPSLASSVALGRALANDPQAALSMRRSAVIKEWLVLPSEVVAFLDCRGHVDYFVPSEDDGHQQIRDLMAQASPQPEPNRERAMTDANRYGAIKNAKSPGFHSRNGSVEDRTPSLLSDQGDGHLTVSNTVA